MAHGTSQGVAVTSEPSGAHLFVNGQPAGMTPIRLDLARWRKGTVLRIEKEGFVPREVALKRTVSGWTLGNLMAANPMARQGLSSQTDYRSTAAKGLAVGFGIDFLTGAAFEFPKSVAVKLEPAHQR
jgi:hypothetical protein